MKNEMSRRQFLGFAGSAAAVLGLGLVGCGGSAGSGSSASGDAAEVYFLQFKPEVDKEWKEIAKAYKEEKGIEVKIVTAASNTYEEKLKSEMSKSSAPTLFQVNGPTGLKNWKDYCADLSDTKLRGELIDDSLALQSDGKDLGIDWVQESYGIIYNKQLLEKAGYKAEDINSFDKLKACADDIQARKDELGVEGAFTSAGMDDSSSWRYTTHLANLPLYYEFEKEHNQEDDEIKGEYLDNFKQIFELYITNGFKLFDQNLALTGGAPAHSTEMLALNIYNTFYSRAGIAWQGIGQAKAVIFCILVVAISMIQLKATRSKEVQQ